MAAGIKVIDLTSVDRALTAFRVIDPNGSDRAMTQINVIDAGGVDRIVWGPASATLAVTATPLSVSGSCKGTGHATSGSTTASASGGTPPYTYSWAVTTYENVTAPTVTAPASATTNFTQTDIGYREDYTATFTVTARDSVAATATVVVSAHWSDTSNGSIP